MKKTILLLLMAAFTGTSFASCNKNEGPIVKGQTYVLVHGAWQAPYVWDAVAKELTGKGHKVITVELPGHGADQTPAYELNLDVYRDKVIQALSKIDGQVILVGHSLGGMVVSHVAEKVPAKISRLVFIGAFVPKSGQALADLSPLDPTSKLGPSLVSSADKLTLDVKREDLTDLFIADGSAASKKLVLDNYRPEPAIPFTTKVTLTSGNFGAVEKVYIKTLKDVVITPGFQDRMIADAGIKTVYSINTSHSPFLAQPGAVADLLLKIGK